MICKHDMNVFINRQLIYNYPEQVIHTLFTIDHFFMHCYGVILNMVAPDTELAGYPSNLFCRISGIRPDIWLNS